MVLVISFYKVDYCSPIMSSDVLIFNQMEKKPEMVKTISSVIELILYIRHLVCYEDNMYYVGSVTFKTRT
jgi:hypothetical protein